MMSGPKAIQLLRDSGGTIRRAGGQRGHYYALGPWAGSDGREALLHYRPEDGRRRSGPGENQVVTPAIVWGDDLREADWLHEEPAPPAKPEGT